MNDLPDSDDASGLHPLSSCDGSEMVAQDSLPDSLPDNDCDSDVDVQASRFHESDTIVSVTDSEGDACFKQADVIALLDALPESDSCTDLGPIDDLPDSELGSDY